MQDTNHDYSTDTKPVRFENNYYRDSGCDVEDSKENVFGKKLKVRCGAVDKWTDRLSVRVTTGGDWNRIIDREIAILKVQYPFLPHQQLRGKAYKRFGIPAVMGAVLSRASAVFGGVIPDELLKSRKKNGRGMSTSRKVAKLESLEEFSKDGKDIMETVIRGNRKFSNGSESLLGVDSAANERIISVVSDDSESPTPDFVFPDEEVPLSIFSKPTQTWTQHSQLWPPEVKIETNRTPTRIVTPNLRLSDKRSGISTNNRWVRPSAVPFVVSPNYRQIVSLADLPTQINVEKVVKRAIVDRDILGEISTNNRGVRTPSVPFVVSPNCSQIVSPAEMPTQINVRKTYANFVGNNSRTKETGLSPLRRRARESISPNPTTSNSAERRSYDQETEPLFDTVDIDDLTQLPTPGSGDFKIRNFARLDWSPAGYGQKPEILARRDSQANRTSRISDNEREMMTNMRTLKRKRNTNGRENDSDENKENSPTKENLRGETSGSKNLVLNMFSKNRLRCFENALMTSRGWYDENENIRSPDSESPKAKKKCLDFSDEISPSFVTENCALTPFAPRGRKKIVDNDEANATSVQRASEIRTNDEKPSVTVAARQEEKSLKKSTHRSTDEIQTPGLRTQLDSADEVSPSFATKDCGLTPYSSRGRKKRVRFVNLSDEDGASGVEENLSVDENEKKLTVELVSLVRSQETKSTASCTDEIRDPESQTQLDSADEVSPSFATKDCGLTPYPSRGRKKSVRFVNLSDEDDASGVKEDLSVDENEKKLTVEPVSLVRSQETKSTASCTDEIRDPEWQTQLDSADEVSPSFVTEDCGLTPYTSRGREKRVRFVNLSDEDYASKVEEDLSVDENEKKLTVEPVSLVRSQETKSTASCTDEIRDPESQTQLDSADEVSPSFAARDCGLTPFSSRGRKKSVNVVNLNAKNDAPSASRDALGDGQDKSSFRKSPTEEKQYSSSTIVINDVCDHISTVGSCVIVYSGDHEEESLPDSSMTYFSGATTETLLSNFCCEYDQSFQSENVGYPEMDADSVRDSGFIDSFTVPMVVINKKVDEILKFLETDIEDDSKLI